MTGLLIANVKLLLLFLFVGAAVALSGLGANRAPRAEAVRKARRPGSLSFAL